MRVSQVLMHSNMCNAQWPMNIDANSLNPRHCRWIDEPIGCEEKTNLFVLLHIDLQHGGDYHWKEVFVKTNLQVYR